MPKEFIVEQNKCYTPSEFFKVLQFDRHMDLEVELNLLNNMQVVKCVNSLL